MITDVVCLVLRLIVANTSPLLLLVTSDHRSRRDNLDPRVGPTHRSQSHGPVSTHGPQPVHGPATHGPTTHGPTVHGPPPSHGPGAHGPPPPPRPDQRDRRRGT